jgi:hypothetical protein
MIVTGSRVESGGPGEDRLAVDRAGDRVLVVVADGAGGTVGGARAAQAACDAAVAAFRVGPGDRGAWVGHLRVIDSTILAAGHGGASTAVIVEIAGGMVSGASVGDGGAWMVSARGVVDLTERQVRKPLLGTGLAEPVAFGPTPMLGRLVVGTDGLFKYAPRARLTAVALAGTPEVAAAALVDAVRMKGGRLQDDVGVVVCDGSQGTGDGPSNGDPRPAKRGCPSVPRRTRLAGPTPGQEEVS